MIQIKLYETILRCDKCGRVTKDDIQFLSKKFIDKYTKKKIFCGHCIQARIHRNEPDWKYEDEFAYDWPTYIPRTLSEEEKLSLMQLFGDF